MSKRKSPNRWFWIILVIPVFILLSMTIQPLLTSYYGQVVSLKTMPFDPRDLFYGDYVMLRYEISQVKESQLEPKLLQQTKGKGWFEAIPVYVSLKKKGNYHVVKQVSITEPRQELYLSGKLYPGDLATGFGYSIEYPIDRYYIAEGSGRGLEKKSAKGALIAQLKVRKGYAILTRVLPLE